MPKEQESTSSASADVRPFVCQGDPDQLLLIADETAMISALDQKQIQSWTDFEYVLCLIIENRILKLYQAHLEKKYQSKWKELDDFLLSEEGKITNPSNSKSSTKQGVSTTGTQKDKKKKMRRKQKKRNKKQTAIE